MVQNPLTSLLADRGPKAIHYRSLHIATEMASSSKPLPNKTISPLIIKKKKKNDNFSCNPLPTNSNFDTWETVHLNNKH
jgi:hypothetical protein